MSLLCVRRVLTTFSLWLFCLSLPVYANFITSINWGFSNYSFEPVETENTMNYYGPSLGLGFGYIIKKRVVMSLAYNQTSGNPRTFHTTGTALYSNLGLGFSFLLGKIVYMGLKFGQGTYQLPTSTEAHEVTGKWQGSTQVFEFGVLASKRRRGGYYKIGVEYSGLSATQKSGEGYSEENKNEPRKLNEFSLMITYVSTSLIKALF